MTEFILYAGWVMIALVIGYHILVTRCLNTAGCLDDEVGSEGCLILLMISSMTIYTIIYWIL